MHGGAGSTGNAASHRRAGISTAWHLLDESEQLFLLLDVPGFIFSFERSREKGMTTFFRDFFPICETSAPAWVYLSQPSKDPLKLNLLHPGSLSPGRRGVGSLPTSPCSPLPGGETKFLLQVGIFGVGTQGFRSHCCPRRPFHSPVLGGCKSSSRH